MSYRTQSFFLLFLASVPIVFYNTSGMGNNELAKGRGTMRLFIGLLFAVGIGSVVVANLINVFGGIQDRLAAVGL